MSARRAPGRRWRALYNNGDQPIIYHPEFLLLVNGVDDNANGWIDEGWDGVDNNGDGQVDELAEWESELWTGAAADAERDQRAVRDQAQARARSQCAGESRFPRRWWST